MTYNKPANMKYTDMAIYIDANVWRIVNKGENPEVEGKIFHYLYSLFYVLACKQKYFNSFDDYDGYALYAAGEIYMLLVDRYKHQGEFRRGRTIVPIKSCLNYIKLTMYAFKVNYQRDNFSQVWDSDTYKDLDNNSMKEYMCKDIKYQYEEEAKETIVDSFTLLPQFVEEVIKETPYANDKLMSKHLYMSCILSFLNNLIFVGNNLDDKVNCDSILKKYNREKDNIILWHLKDDMAPYIKLLLNKVKSKLNKELEDTKSNYYLDDDVLDSLLKANYIDYFGKEKE